MLDVGLQLRPQQWQVYAHRLMLLEVWSRLAPLVHRHTPCVALWRALQRGIPSAVNIMNRIRRTAEHMTENALPRWPLTCGERGGDTLALVGKLGRLGVLGMTRLPMLPKPARRLPCIFIKLGSPVLAMGMDIDGFWPTQDEVALAQQV